MKRPEDVKLGAPVYCVQCDRYHPFGIHVQNTAMLKVPTQEELFLRHLELLVEKMSAKMDPAYQDTVNRRFWELV